VGGFLIAKIYEYNKAWHIYNQKLFLVNMLIYIKKKITWFNYFAVFHSLFELWGITKLKSVYPIFLEISHWLI
jgi:hypothetical protein